MRVQSKTEHKTANGGGGSDDGGGLMGVRVCVVCVVCTLCYVCVCVTVCTCVCDCVYVCGCVCVCMWGDCAAISYQDIVVHDRTEG